MKKRDFLQTGAAAIGVIALTRYWSSYSAAQADSPIKAAQPAAIKSEGSFEITRTEAEWRNLLTSDQFYVLRQHGTELAFSSPLDKQFESGTYHCAGCDLPLFSSETKFDSGTGWPSFFAPLDHAIGTSVDHALWTVRTEVHCRRCGGHLGHVFDDGPAPTGQRYCMNGIALNFVAG